MNNGYVGPYSTQPEVIEDFINGMKVSKEDRLKDVLYGAVLGYTASGAWSHFRRYMREK